MGLLLHIRALHALGLGLGCVLVHMSANYAYPKCEIDELRSSICFCSFFLTGAYVRNEVSLKSFSCFFIIIFMNTILQ